MPERTEDEEIADELESLRSEIIDALARVDRVRRTVGEPAPAVPEPVAPAQSVETAAAEPTGRARRALLLVAAAATLRLCVWWLTRRRIARTRVAR